MRYFGLACLLIGCQTNEKLNQDNQGEIALDADGDGATADVDCDDNNASVYRGADEICDGIDNNCDGEIDESVETVFYVDVDADGFGNASISIAACEPPTGFVEDNTDCDDNEPLANPNATETCDKIDNNCDGNIDEDVTTTYFVDADGDGFGDSYSLQQACELAPGLAEDGTDCDDGDPNINPNAIEVCDEIDNNCDLEIDEGVVPEWHLDSDADGFGDPDVILLLCTQPLGYVADNTDCDDTTALAHPNMVELCDEIDNNCDAQIDEDGSVGEYIFYLDADADGFGNPDIFTVGCNIPSGYSLVAGDCDDDTALANPSMVEICDQIDNNCDTQIDEAGAIGENVFYLDVDADGFGDTSLTTTACEVPFGYAAEKGDCDDNEPNIYPGAIEYCNQTDDDCNGITDENTAIDVSVWYIDVDGDGVGSPSFTLTQCTQPTGYVETQDDCDDSNAAVYPNAIEICDTFDNDCDGLADTDDLSLDQSTLITYYMDMDSDGYGDVTTMATGCTLPINCTEDVGDCDDSRNDVYPNAPEICDAIDNDCDLSIDTDDGDFDTSTLLTYFLDVDGDGYGDTGFMQSGCSIPPGNSSLDGDCSDNDPTINPGATEVCDAVDNDCDGFVDDDDFDVDTATGDTFYMDFDFDGHGDASSTIKACTVPFGYTDLGDDCDDLDPFRNPSEVEVCDMLDNDCDNIADNGEAIGDGMLCPAQSCQEILDNNPSAVSTGYYLDTSLVPERHKCDMDADNGGWTLVWSYETTEVPSYGSSFWGNPNKDGDVYGLSSYRSLLASEMGFSEILFTVYPSGDPTDRIEVSMDFANQIPSLKDAFAGNTMLSDSHSVIAGQLQIQYTGYEWGFNLTCNNSGGGSVRFGQGQDSHCGVFYGLGCTGGVYCGVPDFYGTFMASNTARYYPSGTVYTTFNAVHQIWVR